MGKNKLVVLDRDGVINHDSDNYIKTVDEWVPIEGSIDAIARLKRAGYSVAIASNQSSIGRGFFDVDTLSAMHNKLADLLVAFDVVVDCIVYCPHVPEDDCGCRKPRVGLFEEIARTLNVSLVGAVVVGDSLRDLQAGVTVGCEPVLVLTGKGQRTFDGAMAEGGDALPDGTRVFDDLMAFVESEVS